MVKAAEVSKHCAEDDAWVAINGVVWDVTGFASKHPGGDQIIRDSFGKDGSEAYNTIHGPGLVARHLGAEKRIGELEGVLPASPKPHGTQPQEPTSAKADLNSIVNLSQFREVAEQNMIDGTWGYVAGATEDAISYRMNADWYQRVLFRPRILKKVKTVDMRTKFFGQTFDLPFFNAPTSSVKLSHPDGELAIARASVAFGAPAIIPTMGSYSPQEIVDVLPPGYPFFFQLYVYADRSITKRLLEEVAQLKPLGILFTVDLPVISKREITPRIRKQVQEAGKGKAAAPPPVNNAIDENIGWEDIAWIRECVGDIPIFLKGIQCAADARRALEYGCTGIYLSNHGGRALDTAVPAILTLMEIHASCPEILGKMEIIVDGGIRRGRDILKAICLGASLVGIGRPFLYSLQYGEDGAKKAFHSTLKPLFCWLGDFYH